MARSDPGAVFTDHRVDAARDVPLLGVGTQRGEDGQDEFPGDIATAELGTNEELHVAVLAVEPSFAGGQDGDVDVAQDLQVLAVLLPSSGVLSLEARGAVVCDLG